MACSSYRIVNNSDKPIYFDYQRCDNSMWEYQVPVPVGQSSNFWAFEGTVRYPKFYNNLIEFQELTDAPPSDIEYVPVPPPINGTNIVRYDVTNPNNFTVTLEYIDLLGKTQFVELEPTSTKTIRCVKSISNNTKDGLIFSTPTSDLDCTSNPDCITIFQRSSQLFSYDVNTNTASLLQLKVPSIGFNAMTNKKYWSIQKIITETGIQKIVLAEYNITLNPWTLQFNRYIDNVLPQNYNNRGGLEYYENNKLFIGTTKISVIDISTNNAIEIDSFDLPIKNGNQSSCDDIYFNPYQNKLLILYSPVIFGSQWLGQFDLNGNLEKEIDLSPFLGFQDTLSGIFSQNGILFLIDYLVPHKLYRVDPSNDTISIVYNVNLSGPISDVSQPIECNDRTLDEVPEPLCPPYFYVQPGQIFLYDFVLNDCTLQDTIGEGSYISMTDNKFYEWDTITYTITEYDFTPNPWNITFDSSYSVTSYPEELSGPFAAIANGEFIFGRNSIYFASKNDLNAELLFDLPIKFGSPTEAKHIYVDTCNLFVYIIYSTQDRQQWYLGMFDITGLLYKESIIYTSGTLDVYVPSGIFTKNGKLYIVKCSGLIGERCKIFEVNLESFELSFVKFIFGIDDRFFFDSQQTQECRCDSVDLIGDGVLALAYDDSSPNLNCEQFTFSGVPNLYYVNSTTGITEGMILYKDIDRNIIADNGFYAGRNITGIVVDELEGFRIISGGVISDLIYCPQPDSCVSTTLVSYFSGVTYWDTRTGDQYIIPNLSGGVENAFYLAMSDTKLWRVSARGGFTPDILIEYNINLDPFIVLSQSRTFEINTGFVGGLEYKSENKLFIGDGSVISELDISGSTAVQTTLFNLPRTSSRCNDIYYDRLNEKLIITYTTVLDFKAYVAQYSLDGNLELEILLPRDIYTGYPAGIFTQNFELYLMSDKLFDGELGIFKIHKDTYKIERVDISCIPPNTWTGLYGKVPQDLAQPPSCRTVSFNVNITTFQLNYATGQTEACLGFSTSCEDCYYYTESGFTAITEGMILYTDMSLETLAPAGYYAGGPLPIVVDEVEGFRIVSAGTVSDIVLCPPLTPTPTPTNTSTPTNTPTVTPTPSTTTPESTPTNTPTPSPTQGTRFSFELYYKLTGETCNDFSGETPSSYYMTGSTIVNGNILYTDPISLSLAPDGYYYEDTYAVYRVTGGTGMVLGTTFCNTCECLSFESTGGTFTVEYNACDGNITQAEAISGDGNWYLAVCGSNPVVISGETYITGFTSNCVPALTGTTTCGGGENCGCYFVTGTTGTTVSYYDCEGVYQSYEIGEFGSGFCSLTEPIITGTGAIIEGPTFGNCYDDGGGWNCAL